MGIRKVRMAKHTGKHTAKRSKAAGVAAFLVLMFSGFLLATNLRVNRSVVVTNDTAELVEQRVKKVNSLQTEVDALSSRVNDLSKTLNSQDDADRIAAGDSRGNYVNAHRIITLLTKHMVDRGETGRVVSTVTASAMLDRMCRKLGLELVSTPVGFKWIYGEMEKGGVMIGGEESGGIGLPDHVKERDGLLMALLLTECMAQSGKDLGTIVDEMLADIGRLEFARRGLSITDEQMARFRAETVPTYTADEIAGKRVLDVDRRDGVKLLLEGDAWVMMRPSGTEPLVRIYAEAATTDEVNELLDAAEAVVTSL